MDYILLIYFLLLLIVLAVLTQFGGTNSLAENFDKGV